MQEFEYHFQGLDKAYGDKIVIQDARIKIRNGLCTVLVGENGVGKTTLLKILSGLGHPDSGNLRLDGKALKWGQGKKLVLKNFLYLHQQPYMFDGTVEKNLLYICKTCKQPPQNIQKAVEWAGLESILHQDANNLSGGEKQRVAIARAYLRNPLAVLLDEPTANLDQASKIRTIELLKQFKSQGTAMVIASHDPDIFQEIQDERLQLSKGKLTNLNPRNKRNKKKDITHISSYRAKSA